MVGSAIRETLTSRSDMAEGLLGGWCIGEGVAIIHRHEVDSEREEKRLRRKVLGMYTLIIMCLGISELLKSHVSTKVALVQQPLITDIVPFISHHTTETILVIIPSVNWLLLKKKKLKVESRNSLLDSSHGHRQTVQGIYSELSFHRFSLKVPWGPQTPHWWKQEKTTSR